MSATPFDIVTPPNVSLAEYLSQVMGRLGCADKIIVIALLYAERYFSSMNDKFNRVGRFYAHTYQNSYL